MYFEEALTLWLSERKRLLEMFCTPHKIQPQDDQQLNMRK